MTDIIKRLSELEKQLSAYGGKLKFENMEYEEGDTPEEAERKFSSRSIMASGRLSFSSSAKRVGFMEAPHSFATKAERMPMGPAMISALPAITRTEFSPVAPQSAATAQGW